MLLPTFAANTTELNGVLTKVNDSYQIQADIIQTIHQMDVMKMAMANVNVLKSLDECTKKLETFNAYLNGVETCIASFEKFKQLFDKEAERTQVLEEIRDFFTRHKGEIAKSVTDADVELREALLTVKQTSIDGSYELQKVLIEQSEDFKQISQQISEEFTNQLKLAPQMQKQLAEISQIPAKLDKLIDKIEKSNSDLAKNVANTMEATAQEISGSSSGEISNNGKSARSNRNVFIVMLAFAILMAIVVIYLDFRYNL